MEIAGSVVDSTPCLASLSFSLYAVERSSNRVPDTIKRDCRVHFSALIGSLGDKNGIRQKTVLLPHPFQ
jgi:hypothetical protein